MARREARREKMGLIGTVLGLGTKVAIAYYLGKLFATMMMASIAIGFLIILWGFVIIGLSMIATAAF